MVIGDAAAELRSIAEASDDATGYFPAVYSQVTTKIASSIARGQFADGDRMNAFATEFASRYLRAWKHEVTPPRCWQGAWDVVDEHLLIVQHLLLGINAHVNYDLPQSVAAVARKTHDLESAREDFDAVNDVLAAMSVDVLRNLDRVSRWTSKVAALGGGRMFNFSLRTARAQAWQAAERLYVLDEQQRRSYVAELDRLVSVLAYMIARPSFPTTLFVSAARRLEERDPRIVTAVLLE